MDASKSPDWPKILLVMEGAALAVVALFAYGRIGGSWFLFGLLFMAPDLAMLFEVAESAGLAWLMFDREAAVIEGLPVFDTAEPGP